MAYLLALVGGFATGIFMRSVLSAGWPVMAFALLLGLLFAGGYVFQKRRGYMLGALFLLLFIAGIGRAWLSEGPLPAHLAGELKSRVSLVGTVVGNPDIRDANQRVAVQIEDGGERVRMLVVAPRYPEVSASERVQVSGTLELPESFADPEEGGQPGQGRVFRYDKYLEARGIRFLVSFASIKVVEEAPWWSPSAALARVRSVFLEGLNRALPEPYASLAGGIVIGGKSGLGTELLDAFITTGLVQVIVLSGYNVMVVAEGLLAALGALGVRRRYALVAGALAVALFVLIAGAAATAVRAGLMALIALYARATGRSYAAGRALFFVILLMLVWNPLLLAYDPGFGLSVVATAGLIWLAPRIELYLARIRNAFARNMIATTLAAQVAVLPLLLHNTGILSLVSIPANLLVLPVVPAAMAAAAIAGVAGIFSSTFALIMAFPAYLLTGYLVWIAKTLSALPFAAVRIPAFSFWIVLAAYAALIGSYFAWSKRSSTTLQFTLSKKAST